MLPEKSSGVPAPNRVQSPWSPEHARVSGTRDVTVEAILNGRPVASRRLTADGVLRDLAFDVPIERSSWIALRILVPPTPILFLFLSVGGPFARQNEAPSGA